jgi:hypothetical protein
MEVADRIPGEVLGFFKRPEILSSMNRLGSVAEK